MTKSELLKYIDSMLTQRSDGNIGLLMVRQYVEDNMKTGAWIGRPLAGYCTVRCSVCNDAFCDNNGRWKYCPTCGAEMGGEEE